jgi:hypothetical protein
MIRQVAMVLKPNFKKYSLSIMLSKLEEDGTPVNESTGIIDRGHWELPGIIDRDHWESLDLPGILCQMSLRGSI